MIAAERKQTSEGSVVMGLVMVDPVADTLLQIFDEADEALAALRIITEDKVVSKVRHKPTH